MSNESNGTITIKTKFNKDLRKIKLSSPVDFINLTEIIGRNYNLNKEEFDVYYIDEEKDKITIGNTQDLKLAIEECLTSSLKVYVRKTINSTGKSNTPETIILSSPQQLISVEFKEENKQLKRSNKKKLKEEELIKIQKDVNKYDDLTPKSYNFSDYPNSVPYQNPQDTEPIIRLQKPVQLSNQSPSESVQPFIPFQSHPEDSKPIMKLNKPVQSPPPQNNQPIQPFIPFQSHPEDTKPIMKLNKPVQSPQTQPIQSFIPFQTQNQQFQDHPEDTKPIMKLNKPVQSPQTNQQTQPIQPFIPFQTQNQQFQSHPEDTKPIMKLNKPVQSQQTNQQTQPIQSFIPFQNQQFQDHPEDTKPIMKLVRPVQSTTQNDNQPKQQTQPIQPFIPFQSHPEDTKPIMKLNKPVQSTTQNEKQQTQPIQPFIPFQNQQFQDHPEDTKPIMKLNKPKQPQQQFPYENQLKEILLLGFKDDQNIRNILVKNNGNIQNSIVEALN